MKNSFPVVLASALSLAACGSTPSLNALHGEFAGKQLATTVDDPIASYYVERYLAGDRANKDWDGVLRAIDEELRERVPTARELERLSRAHSTDLAALILARQLDRQAQRHPLYRAFHAELSTAYSGQQQDSGDSTGIDQAFLFVFVPGWLYKTDPATGADFARFRDLLAHHGARVALAATGENNSVEANASILAATIRALAASERGLVLVSGSKGGPETELALTLLRDDAASQSVKAWVNIGGLLGGTPLADIGLAWPVCWFVQFAVLPDGSFEGIRSLALAPSARRRHVIHLPEHVLVVNYVGIPLSGQVSKQAQGGYARLRGRGPNDGLTFLTDAISARGVTIPEFGVDHYFRSPDIELRTLALARAVTRYVQAQDARQGAAADWKEAALSSVR